MMTSAELVEAVKRYEPQADESILKKAYMFAMEAHGSQKRSSGIPYFSHPVEVAAILIDMKMDVDSIITALLHDVVEDTEVGIEQINEDFGVEIAFMVQGVTKLSKLTYSSEQTNQSDNFRKFLMALSEDIRILVVKLADRLHNMRTINAIRSKDKRQRIAAETMEIYAPLAERIGMQTLKDELEDKAFYILYPDEYNTILSRLEQIKRNDVDFIKNVISKLDENLEGNGIPAQIYGREKRPCSIWKKMCKQNVALEQLNDLIAFRIVVNSPDDCYRTLGVVHSVFPILPGRFKDYISIPKLNNYRSLHTTVLGPYQQKIEIQIRTQEMHLNAEQGLAAHWSYKSGALLANKSSSYRWLQALMSVLESTNSSADILSDSKLEMHDTDVFCFTPKGELISLARGSTCIDFAYAIHTSVGNRCIGAKINGRILPLKTKLRNGDQVEILTSPFQKPDPSWYSFVTTGKAKSTIKKFVKIHENAEYAKLGSALVRQFFEKMGVSFNELEVPLRSFNCSTLQSFYAKLAKSEISFQRIHSLTNKMSKLSGNAVNHELCISGFSPGVAVHYGECCNPIPGDNVFGVLVPYVGLVIHTELCTSELKIGEARIDNVIWDRHNHKDDSLIIRLKVVVLNKVGSLAQLTTILGAKGADITNIKLEDRSKDFQEILLDVKVRSLSHWGEIQASVNTCSRVRSIRRM